MLQRKCIDMCIINKSKSMERKKKALYCFQYFIQHRNIDCLDINGDKKRLVKKIMLLIKPMTCLACGVRKTDKLKTY